MLPGRPGLIVRNNLPFGLVVGKSWQLLAKITVVVVFYFFLFFIFLINND